MAIQYSEEFKEISFSLDREISDIQYKYARRFLELFRNILSEYAIQNHKIEFLCAMGSCSLKINNRHLHDYYYLQAFKIVRELMDIEQALEWEWASHLDGVCLNG